MNVLSMTPMPAAEVNKLVYTARVRAADGVRFTASGPTESLETQLAAYITSRCDDVLWPAMASEVHRLIADHQEEAAIAAYFANVGRRWDAEWLEVKAE